MAEKKEKKEVKGKQETKSNAVPKKEAKEHIAKKPEKEAPKKVEAPEKKESKKETAKGKEEPAKKEKVKKEKKSRKVVVKKEKIIEKNQAEILKKINTPTFRGQFGKRTIRKKSKAKWDKWRFPRGIDIKHEICDGFRPKGGYRTAKAVRDIHPSGFKEHKVSRLADLETVPKNYAIRIDAGIGKRKKLEIVDKAISKKIKVLNP